MSIKICIVNDVLALETYENEPIASLGACRSADNTPQAPYNYTHGVLAWVLYDAYVLKIEEILHRETTTFIILSFMKMFMWGDPWFAFYERMMALCFDVICGVLLRLLNVIKLGLLSMYYIYHLCKLMYCMALDKFHANKHERLICKSNPKVGILHPDLPKFKGILNACPTRNEQVYQFYFIYYYNLV